MLSLEADAEPGQARLMDDATLAAWVAATDEALRRRYGIGVGEASPEQLETAWRLGETPDVFAAWFGSKYGLQELDEVR